MSSVRSMEVWSYGYPHLLNFGNERCSTGAQTSNNNRLWKKKAQNFTVLTFLSCLDLSLNKFFSIPYDAEVVLCWSVLKVYSEFYTCFPLSSIVSCQLGRFLFSLSFWVKSTFEIMFHYFMLNFHRPIWESSLMFSSQVQPDFRTDFEVWSGSDCLLLIPQGA